jgi:hypothetical protein
MLTPPLSLMLFDAVEERLPPEEKKSYRQNGQNGPKSQPRSRITRKKFQQPSFWAPAEWDAVLQIVSRCDFHFGRRVVGPPVNTTEQVLDRGRQLNIDRFASRPCWARASAADNDQWNDPCRHNANSNQRSSASRTYEIDVLVLVCKGVACHALGVPSCQRTLEVRVRVCPEGSRQGQTNDCAYSDAHVSTLNEF